MLKRLIGRIKQPTEPDEERIKQPTETDEERRYRIAVEQLERELREYHVGVHPSQMHPSRVHGVILRPIEGLKNPFTSKERK